MNKYWAETLEPNGAEMIGVYADTFREGTGVISRNSYGNGVAYYLGTGVEPQLLGELANSPSKTGESLYCRLRFKRA